MNNNNSEFMHKAMNTHKYNKKQRKLNESLKLDEDYNTIWKNVRGWFEGKIDYIETNSVLVIKAEHPEYGYDPDWCETSGWSDTADRLEDARNKYLDALTDLCFVNYDGE